MDTNQFYATHYLINGRIQVRTRKIPKYWMKLISNCSKYLDKLNWVHVFTCFRYIPFSRRKKGWWEMTSVTASCLGWPLILEWSFLYIDELNGNIIFRSFIKNVAWNQYLYLRFFCKSSVKNLLACFIPYATQHMRIGFISLSNCSLDQYYEIKLMSEYVLDCPTW